MLIIASFLTALSCLVACTNIAGCIAASVRKVQGVDKGYSNVPFLSLLFALVAWFLSHEEFGLWPLLPAALDPGTWMTLYFPWVIWTEFIRKH